MNNEKMTHEEKVELMKRIAHDPEARQAFAASLSLPLLQRVREETSVRKIFAEDELPSGALPRYPVEFYSSEMKALMIPKQGAEIPMVQIEGDEVTVPTFVLSYGASFNIFYARDGRYNVREAVLRTLTDAFVKAEEEEGWKLVRAAIGPNNTLQIPGETTLSKNLISEMIVYFDKKGYRPDLLVCSVKRAADIRLWGTEELDDSTRREVFRQGGMGSIWGVDILPLRRLADDEVYMFDTSRFGVMPIRERLQVFDDPTAIKQLKVGLLAYEELGFAVIDNTAVVKGVIASS